MEFVDIAGLVEGASRGEGLGNQFLSHIRETDAIAHVVRCFEDEDVVHVTGRVDPLADIAVINTELALADLETVLRAIERAEKRAKASPKEVQARLAVLRKLEACLDEGRRARNAGLSDDEALQIRDLQLITTKPVMYVANVDEEGFDGNPLLDRVADLAQQEGAVLVTVCAAIEAELAVLDDEDRQEMLEGLGMSEPGLEKVIHAGYRLLGLLTFFTAGEREVRAWTVKEGATAPQAAGRIHSDFEKGFIRAEVMAYDDFVTLGGEQAVRDAGKWRLEGRNYRVCEADIMHFRFNV